MPPLTGADEEVALLADYLDHLANGGPKQPLAGVAKK
jgi:hypothetical protein